MRRDEQEQATERRKNSGLSPEQVEAIKEAILASIYEDIGRSIVRKVLWALGALALIFLAWIAGKERLFSKIVE